MVRKWESVVAPGTPDGAPKSEGEPDDDGRADLFDMGKHGEWHATHASGSPARAPLHAPWPRRLQSFHLHDGLLFAQRFPTGPIL